MTSETSSASNVRRIEALTGPAAARLFEERSQRVHELSRLLRVPEQELVPAVERLTDRVKELQRSRVTADSAAAPTSSSPRRRTSRACTSWFRRWRAWTPVSCSTCRTPCARSLVTLWWCWEHRADGRVHLVANVAPEVVERGVKAGEVVRAAAQVAGGGGGGRDTMAQAGGRDPAKLPDALATAKREVEKALGAPDARTGPRPRLGALRLCPLGSFRHAGHAPGRGRAPGHAQGTGADRALAQETGAERIVVGLPLTLAGEEGSQATAARAFAERLARRVSVPVELHDERLTTRLAERIGGQGDADSRAAAHLLESYLARARAGTPE